MYDNFNNDEILDDDFEMLDDNSDSNVGNTFNNSDVNTFSNNSEMVDSNESGSFVSNDFLNFGPQSTAIDNSNSFVDNTQTFGDIQNTDMDQMVDSSASYDIPNSDVSSSLESMYDTGSGLNYEDELKTAKPFEEEVEAPIVEEPKEITYTNDVMDYDPMLHNDLQTDGNYTITQFNPNEASDYVPEQTNFDSEDMMEYYSEQNVEQPKTQEEIKAEEPKEVFNTTGMQYDTNNVDTFNGGDTPQETVVTRFIFNDMKNDENTMDETAGRREVGAISVYNKDGNNGKSQTRKTVEMVATVLIFALLILVVSFFPDINKIFTNFGK